MEKSITSSSLLSLEAHEVADTFEPESLLNFLQADRNAALALFKKILSRFNKDSYSWILMTEILKTVQSPEEIQEYVHGFDIYVAESPESIVSFFPGDMLLSPILNYLYSLKEDYLEIFLGMNIEGKIFIHPSEYSGASCYSAFANGITVEFIQPVLTHIFLHDTDLFDRIYKKYENRYLAEIQKWLRVEDGDDPEELISHRITSTKLSSRILQSLIEHDGIWSDVAIGSFLLHMEESELMHSVTRNKIKSFIRHFTENNFLGDEQKTSLRNRMEKLRILT